MNIEMDYPNNAEISRFYDGKTHKIKPISIFSIELNGREVYVMQYVDISLGEIIMTTILEKKDNIYFKVPLIKYGKDFEGFRELVQTMGRRYNVSELPQHIYTRSKPTELTSFLEEKNLTQTKRMQIIFYDISSGKYYWDKGCKYAIEGAPESLGTKKGNIIIGKHDVDYKIEIIEKKYKRGIVYYSEHHRKYYYDENGEKEIKNISLFGKKIGNQIIGEDTIYDIRNVIKVAVGVQIFYNEADGKYYYDPSCKSQIVNVSELNEYARTNSNPKDGDTIQVSDKLLFVIKKVYVEKYKRTIPDSIIKIYYNEETDKFYYDRECKNEIKDILQLDSMRQRNTKPKSGEKVKIAENLFFEIEVVKKKKVIPIYYDQSTGKFYLDSTGKKEIKGLPSSLGKQIGKTITGSNNTTFQILSLIKTKQQIEIFYNDADGKYYADERCTSEISGAPDCLGNVSSDNTLIIGSKVDFKVTHVYVDKIIGLNEQIQELKQNGIRQVFYNEYDNSYYWDRKCTQKIDGAPYVLGNLENGIIKGRMDIDFIIVKVNIQTKKPYSMFEERSASTKSNKKVYFNSSDNSFYWDKECTIEIDGGIKTLGALIGDKIIGRNGELFDVIYVTFEDTSSSIKR